MTNSIDEDEEIEDDYYGEEDDYGEEVSKNYKTIKKKT